MGTPLIAMLLAAFTAGAAGAADVPAAVVSTHVRPLTDSTRTLLADGIKRSDTIARLVRELDGTDVTVYLVDCMVNDSTAPTASLRFISDAGGRRYLLIKIDRWLAPPWVRLAELGHELQHAVEVAKATDVRNGKDLARLYRRIGWENERNRFESRAAVAMGNRVMNEMLGYDR